MSSSIPDLCFSSLQARLGSLSWEHLLASSLPFHSAVSGKCLNHFIQLFLTLRCGPILHAFSASHHPIHTPCSHENRAGAGKRPDTHSKPPAHWVSGPQLLDHLITLKLAINRSALSLYCSVIESLHHACQIARRSHVVQPGQLQPDKADDFFM